MIHIQTGIQSIAYNGATDATLTDYVVSNLVLNDDYTFWVTALNPLESIPSSTVTLWAAQSPAAPGAITQISGTQTGNSL